MKNKYLASLTMGVVQSALALWGAKAEATLVESDWNTIGDNAILIDSETQLEWLDLSLTAGLSFDYVSANLITNGDFEGFRYASRTELHQLLTNAQIPHTNTPYHSANHDPVVKFLTLWDALLYSNGYYRVVVP